MTDEIKKRIELIKCGEVPEKYKKAYAGIIPQEWNADKLFIHIEEYNKTVPDDGTYPVVTSSRNGLLLQSEYYLQQRFAETKGGYHVVPKGYVTYRHMSDDGIFRFNINTIAEKVLVSPEYPVFFTSEKLLIKYLVGFLNTSALFRTYCQAQKKGSTRTRLYLNSLRQFIMPVPPIQEQEKIVEILTQCDKVIELKKQLIAEERKLKKWLMQNLLNPNSGVRLPGFVGSWSNQSLYSLGRFFKGTGISNNDCASGEIPCIKYGDIYMSYNVQFIKTVSYAEETAVNVSPKVQSGTLLFTGSGEDRMEIGKCTAYMGTVSIAVGGDIIIMEPDCRKAYPIFLSYQLNTEKLIKQKARLAQGYSIVHLYTEHIKGLQVSIPPTIEEQTAITNTLSTADCKIEIMEQEVAQWQQKKKSLMQLLLTGIVRVNV